MVTHSPRHFTRRGQPFIPTLVIITGFVFLASCLLMSLWYLKAANQELLWLMKALQKLEDSKTYLEGKLLQSDNKVVEYFAYKGESDRLKVELQGALAARNAVAEQKEYCQQSQGSLRVQVQQLETEKATLAKEKEDVGKQKDAWGVEKSQLESQLESHVKSVKELESQLKEKEQALVGAQNTVLSVQADAAAKAATHAGQLEKVQASLSGVEDDLLRHKRFSEAVVKKLNEFKMSGSTDFGSIIKAIMNDYRVMEGKPAIDDARDGGNTLKGADKGNDADKGKAGDKGKARDRAFDGEDFTEIVLDDDRQ